MASNPPLRHVVVIAIGPVQPFIAAARRTRDLWYGSVLLSRLATAASQAIVRQCAAPASAKLVFPPSAVGGGSGLTAGVSNKIVCVVSGIAPATPATLVGQVRAAVEAELRSVGREALQALRSEGCQSEEQRFHLQLRQLLECYGAWAPWQGTGDAGYVEAYCSANELLDARKRLRDFQPNATAEAGLPLSSLDAAAETVIPSGRDGRRLRAVFGIDATEELDAIGLVKRVLGRKKGFPAVTRIALAPWVEAWPDAVRQDLEAVLTPLEPFKVASRNLCTTPDPSAKFRWDGELLLRSRRQALMAPERCARHAEALGLDAGELQAALKALDDHVNIKANREALGLPGDDALYVALLLADGDRLGVRLSEDQQSLPGHQALSTALAAFSGTAQTLIFAAGGACIYAGGDDVLALCPVDSAVSCARALADAFGNDLPQVQGAAAPTLSVGVAMAHVLTPFGTLRRLAQRAKELAKQGLDVKQGLDDRKNLRNALGVIVQPRNGAAVAVCGRWNESAGSLPCAPGFDHRLRWWTDAFASGGLAGSAPYDLGMLARAVPEQALVGEALRLVGRRIDKRALAAGDANKLLAHVAQHLGAGVPCDAAARLADEWYAARWLATHRWRPSSQAQPAASGATATGSQPNPADTSP